MITVSGWGSTKSVGISLSLSLSFSPGRIGRRCAIPKSFFLERGRKQGQVFLYQRFFFSFSFFYRFHPLEETRVKAFSFNLGDRWAGREGERFESKLAFLLIAAFIGNRHANSNNDEGGGA